MQSHKVKGDIEGVEFEYYKIDGSGFIQGDEKASISNYDDYDELWELNCLKQLNRCEIDKGGVYIYISNDSNFGVRFGHEKEEAQDITLTIDNSSYQYNDNQSINQEESKYIIKNLLNSQSFGIEFRNRFFEKNAYSGSTYGLKAGIKILNEHAKKFLKP